MMSINRSRHIHTTRLKGYRWQWLHIKNCNTVQNLSPEWPSSWSKCCQGFQGHTDLVQPQFGSRHSTMCCCKPRNHTTCTDDTTQQMKHRTHCLNGQCSKITPVTILDSTVARHSGGGSGGDKWNSKTCANHLHLAPVGSSLPVLTVFYKTDVLSVSQANVKALKQ